MNKSQLRCEFRDHRESLCEEVVDEASCAICERLADWPMMEETQTVLTYLAFKNEPDLRALFDLLPHIRWIVPRIEGDHLVLHPYDPDNLVRHPFGMLEPPADAPTVDPKRLDMVLVPGVAFDRRGGRIGFGGGYYDRLLSSTPALRVGVTYSQCLADEIPCEEHDQRMDWVVTQKRMIHCAPLWREECDTSPGREATSSY